MQYQLRSTRYFYGSKNIKAIVQDDCYGSLILPSRKAAKAWINEQNQTIYHLSHGEHARPTYTLVPIR